MTQPPIGSGAKFTTSKCLGRGIAQAAPIQVLFRSQSLMHPSILGTIETGSPWDTNGWVVHTLALRGQFSLRAHRTSRKLERPLRRHPPTRMVADARHRLPGESVQFNSIQEIDFDTRAVHCCKSDFLHCCCCVSFSNCCLQPHTYQFVFPGLSCHAAVGQDLSSGIMDST